MIRHFNQNSFCFSEILDFIEFLNFLEFTFESGSNRGVKTLAEFLARFGKVIDLLLPQFLSHDLVEKLFLKIHEGLG